MNRSTGALSVGLRLAEGLAAALLFPLWWLAYLRAGPKDPERGRQARTRYARWIIRGIGDFRAEWWLPFSLEPRRTLYRQLVLLEWFDLQNAAKARGTAKPSGNPVNRVLIATFGHIGDILHHGPLVRALHEKFPSAEIDLLVGPWSRDIATCLPGVSAVRTYTPDYVQYHRGNRKGVTSMRGEIRFLQSLREREYEVLITTGNEHPVNLLTAVAVAPGRWSGTMERLERYRPLSRVVSRPYGNSEPEAGRILGLASCLDVPADEAALTWPLPPPSDESAAIGTFRESVHPRIVMAPGSGWSGKCWPPERFSEVGKWIRDELRGSVTILGSAGEQSLSASVAGAIGGTAIDLAGKTSLAELGVILAEADLLLCNDSGPMHIAAAVGTPTVSMFGPTWPSQWSPPGEVHRSLRGGSGCPSCLPWHPNAVCSESGRCMREISIPDIQNAIRELCSALEPAADEGTST